MVELTRKSVEPPKQIRRFDDYKQRLGDEMRGRRASLGKSILDIRRELGIKPCTIRAIEECDDQSFDAPAFVSGVVRRYATYLGLDPEETYARFRRECQLNETSKPWAGSGRFLGGARRASAIGFAVPAHGTPIGISSKQRPSALSKLFSGLSFTSVGSTMMLMLLVVGISYLGWTIYAEVQRLPSVQVAGRFSTEPASPVVEIEQVDRGGISLVGEGPTDSSNFSVNLNAGGPLTTIGEIEPGSIGATLTKPIKAESDDESLRTTMVPSIRLGATDATQPKELPLTIIATRPSWMRVKTEDGTVLLEKVLSAGDEYAVPKVDGRLTLRSGNAGFVYFVVGQQAFGPAGNGAGVVRNIDLSEDSIRGIFAEISPEHIPTEVMNLIQLTESRTNKAGQ